MSSESSLNQFGLSVGTKIREARLAQKLTQSQLASPDFSVSYISAIERGQIHPSIRALEILANRLNLSSTQLLPIQMPGEPGQFLSSGLLAHGDDEVELLLLEAQIWIRQGNAQRTLDLLQKLVTKNLKRRQQAHVRYLLGWAQLALGQLHEAETLLSEAEQLLKEQAEFYISSRILYHLGIVYSCMHNYAQALLIHERCLAEQEKDQPQDPFFLAQVYANIGQHYIAQQRVDQAVKALQQAITALGLRDAEIDPEATYLKLSQESADLGKYQLATLYAYKSLQLHNQRFFVIVRSELYHSLYHALMAFDQGQARAKLDESLSQISPQRDPLLSASTTFHLANWYFLQQSYSEAREYAQRARELATPFGNTLISAENLLLLGRIAYKQKSYEAGDRDFRDGLAMLEELHINEDELADQYIHYSQLLEARGRDHEAFTYVRKAFEIRQKISRLTHE